MNPEENHTPKGKRGRPSNNPKFKKNYQEGDDDKTQPIKKDKPPKKDNPLHDTEKDMNRTRTHWRKAPRQYLVDQLAKHGWRWPKTPDGKIQNLHKIIGPNYDWPA